MLNCQELADRMFVAAADSSLTVIPSPDETQFRAEAGASIDLRLGRWFRTMKQSNLHILDLANSEHDSRFTKEHFVPFGQPFILHPGKFVLGITLEWLHLPGDLAGYVTGKSSLGRRGLIIETAAGVQPGFAGCLTLELANVGEIPIRLVAGMKICQLFLHQASSGNPNATSQFKGSRKPGLGTTN
ncbi:dCTP deaminase [Sinorhizobium alkalisoli]|uniref:dCTP deaminase n=1 Tax=Sinorhizobium alkalisoli TaxID=1752398 RepID=UPI001AEE00A2|nr:dCTP deaminase [Sinorhizobium alkalisoli]